MLLVVVARLEVGSIEKLMSQCTSAGSGEDSRMDLVMGSVLRTEVASNSNSWTNALAGSGTMEGGSSCTCSMAEVDSGSISVVGSGVKVRSVAENLSCCLAHSGLGRRFLSGVCREITAFERNVLGSWRWCCCPQQLPQ